MTHASRDLFQRQRGKAQMFPLIASQSDCDESWGVPDGDGTLGVSIIVWDRQAEGFIFWYTCNLSTLVGDLISSSPWPKGDGEADQHHWRALDIYQETTAVSNSKETFCVAAVLAVATTGHCVLDTNSWVIGQELLHFNIRFGNRKLCTSFLCVCTWWQSSFREHWVTGHWVAAFLSCIYDIIAVECQSLGVQTFSKL